MIFSELYSAYYNTVARILARLLEGDATEKELQELVAAHAFGESALTILPSLKSGKWQLMRPDLTTPITHPPTMPLTGLEKRWLKAISLDPRIRLFDLRLEGLEEVEPLFTQEDYLVYDRYGDGDPFDDEGYIRRFRFLRAAIREHAPITAGIVNRNGREEHFRCIPVRLEYSEKDDKFRLLTAGCRFFTTVNLARLTFCERYCGEHVIRPFRRAARYESVTLRITDERNALERCMLHFAHFEKRAERLERNRYLVHIRYDSDDELELVIRVLSFGPLVEVTEPERFRELVRERLKRQKSCGAR